MNFEIIESMNGELAPMFGALTSIEGLGTTNTGKAFAKCKITDDAGITHNVRIYQGKGQLPSATQINQRLALSISTYEGNHPTHGAYKGYSGFWNNNSPAPQNQQAPPQNQRKKPNGDPDWDAIAAGKVRTCFIAAGIESNQIKCDSIEECNYWVEYAITGNPPCPPGQEGDIPF